MKRLVFILSITCIAFFNVSATSFSYHDDKTKRGYDKKSKAKRDDTTKFVINTENIFDNEEESPDTAQILFPSHDLYASWDTLMAHPYNFAESFTFLFCATFKEGKQNFQSSFARDLNRSIMSLKHVSSL